MPVYIERVITNVVAEEAKKYNVGDDVSVFNESVKSDTSYQVARDPSSNAYVTLKADAKPPKGERVVVPVYVGVGLRLTASVTVTSETANLSSLGAIAADAQSGKLVGSLVVQTLGITGSSVATTLPLPSDLNETTVQNAILALGSIKAILYDAKTDKAPRVVGIYNPAGGGQQVVNGIISVLVSDPIKWFRPCGSNT